MARVNGGSGPKVIVLYKIVNIPSENDGLYNAFTMSRGSGVSLSSVKAHCRALRSLSHAGPDGYHWRVRVDEKTQSSSSKAPSFSWWDIQDESAKLPVKEVSPGEVEQMFSSTSTTLSSTASSPSSAPSSANDFTSGSTSKFFGKAAKAMGKAAGVVESGPTPSEFDHRPRVSVIAFKLIDMVKIEDKYSQQVAPSSMMNGAGGVRPGRKPMSQMSMKFRSAALKEGGGGSKRTGTSTSPTPPPAGPTRVRIPPPGSKTHTSTAGRSTPTAAEAKNRQVTPPPGGANRPAPAPAPAPAVDLMNFGQSSRSLPTKNVGGAAIGVAPAPAPAVKESRVEKLKRDYDKQKEQQKKDMIWDEIDQRWVHKDTSGGEHKAAKIPPSASTAGLGIPKKKAVGVKLDETSAVGKSATVQAAVSARVQEMRTAQQKAKAEVRQREQEKAKAQDEEDAVRLKLEPKIKVWAEEHGKKKALRALLSSLHTILWDGAEWKPVSLGDILVDGKCKRCFHMASRVVHPDKTGHLDPEKRFLAKRIFDALSQAKTEFDEGAQ